MFRALLHFFALALATLPAVAQVYKWVDENGVTHYDERPPQGRKASEVPNRLATPAPLTGEAGRAAAEKSEAKAERRRETCAQQRELLARLRQSASSGGRDTSRDAEREAALAKQAQAVAEACA